VAGALFTATQQRVLSLLFGQPERSFFTKELIDLAGGGSGAVQRELARLQQSGLIEQTLVGNRKHYQANAQAPIFAELRGIVAKMLGPADRCARHWPLRPGLRRRARALAGGPALAWLPLRKPLPGVPVLTHTLGLEAVQWRVLDQANRKRNLAEYEGELDVDDAWSRPWCALPAPWPSGWWRWGRCRG
jgi:hypothetical protein